MKVFRVNVNGKWNDFLTFEAAKAFAEKASWDNATAVKIHCPDGREIEVDVNK